MFTRFLVADIDVEGEDDQQGDQGCPPVDDEHHHTAQNCPSKRHPHVVVFKAGAPAYDVEPKHNGERYLSYEVGQWKDLWVWLGLPGELAREAWNTEKLMRAYEARKKLEMIGAMMFSSATQRTENMFYPPNHQRINKMTVSGSRDHQQPTDEDKG